MWRVQLDAVRATGREAVAVDLPGHGADVGGRFTLDACRRVLDATVAELGARPVVLVGLSLGGYVGLHWAARRPGSVEAVVAAGCSAVPGGPLTGGWILAARAIGLMPDRGAGLNAALVRAAIPPAGAADLAEGGYALDAMVDLLRAVSGTDPVADLASLGCPVWLVSGRWDHFRLGERTFLRAAPWTRRRLVPHATHLVSLVAPVPFTRLLLEILDEVDDVSRVEPLRVGGRGGSAVGGRPSQAPGADAADDPRRVRDDHHVVAEQLEHRRPDPSGVAAADVEPVPVEDRAQPVDGAPHPA